jgi:hypothetical protein
MMLGAMVVLSGCVHTGVCTAVGFASTVEIDLSGATDAIDAVDSVRICVDDACTMPDESITDAPIVVTQSVDPTAYSTFDPESEPKEVPIEVGGYATQVDDNTWGISMFTGTPDEVTVQALSADGVILAQTATELEFVRVGGTEQCGGPTRAEVELEIPA